MFEVLVKHHQQKCQEWVIYWNAARGYEVGFGCSRSSFKATEWCNFEIIYESTTYHHPDAQM